MTTPAVSPTTAVARHWLLTAILGLLGLALGAGAALALPSTYTAEARLAVSPKSSSAYSIAGFPLAATELASNYARWVQNNAASGQWRPDGVASVTASPVPDTAVVRIEVTGPDEAQAVAGAGTVADRLEKVVEQAQGRNDPENAYRAFQQRAAEVSAAQSDVTAAEAAYGRSATAANKKVLDDATTKMTELKLRQDGDADLYRRLYSDPQGNTNLRRLGEASSMGSDRKSNLQRGGVLGLALGLVVALPIALALERRRGRRAARHAEDPTEATTTERA